jgi:hypothetical protein
LLQPERARWSRGGKSQEGRQSRKRPANPAWAQYPEEAPVWCSVPGGGEPREGTYGGSPTSSAGERTLEGRNPRRATRSRQPKPLARMANSCVEQSLEGDGGMTAGPVDGVARCFSARSLGSALVLAPGRSGRAATPTPRRHRPRRRGTAAQEEQSSEGSNPKSGSGLKNSQQTWMWVKAPRGCENLKVPGGSPEARGCHEAAVPRGETL